MNGDERSDELLDTFDDSLAAGEPTARSIVHRDGLWHSSFHCLAVRTRPPARVLLQRRKRSARSFPGLLDLTATGHLIAGEDARGGVRELEEEVGIVADATALVPLGRRLIVDGAGEGLNREIVHAFLLPTDQPLESFDLRGRDADGLIEISVADLLRLLGDSAERAVVRELDAQGKITSLLIGVGDLVPPVDGYWTVVAVMAERFVAGQRPLAI